MRGQSSSHAVYVISKKFFVTVWEAWGPSEVRQPTHNTSKAEMKSAGCTDGEVEGGQGETNATRKKKEQIFHICSSNASKGILYLRMNGSWATKHLWSHNPADLNRAVYLLEGEKKLALSFDIASPVLLPVVAFQAASLYTRANTPCALQVLSWSLQLCMTSVQQSPCLGCNSNQLPLFSQRAWKWDSCVQSRTTTTLRKGVICFVLKQIELLTKASEILKELRGTQCNT